MLGFFYFTRSSRAETDRLERLISTEIITREKARQLTKSQLNFILQVDITFAMLAGDLDINKMLAIDEDDFSYWKRTISMMRTEVHPRLSLKHIFELGGLCPLFLQKKLNVVFLDNLGKYAVHLPCCETALTAAQLTFLRKIMAIEACEREFIFGYDLLLEKILQLNTRQRAIISDDERMRMVREGDIRAAVIRPLLLEKDFSYTPGFYQSVTRTLRDQEPEWAVISQAAVHFES